MADRVVDGHDVAVHVERVRHVHIAADRAAHAFGNHRLAVSRGSVEEHGLAGVDRRAEVLEHVVVDDEVREAAAQAFAIDVPSRGLQRSHFGDVRGKRDRRRTGVLTDGQELPRPIATKIGERIPIACGARPGGAAHLNEQRRAQPFDERLDERVRQTRAVRDGHAGGLRAVHRLDEQLLDLIERQSGFFDRTRDRRNRSHPVVVPERHGRD